MLENYFIKFAGVFIFSTGSELNTWTLPLLGRFYASLLAAEERGEDWM